MNPLLDLVSSAGPASLYARGLLLLVIAATLAPVVRDPAARHGVWLGALLALLALPLLAVPSFGAVMSIDLPFSVSAADLSTGLPATAQPLLEPGLTSTPASRMRAVERTPGSFGAGSVLGLLWAIGVLVLAARLTRQRRQLTDVARCAREAGALWDDGCREAATALGVRRRVAVRLSPDIEGPLLWGVLRPVVLLPETAAAWTPGMRRSVLLHELAHVRRLDTAAGLVADVACVLYWANPLVWLAARRVHESRELACDAAVVRAGVARADYSDHLLAVARAVRPGGHVAPALAMAGGSLRARVVHVLDAPVRPRWSSWLGAMVCLALALPLSALRAVPVEAVSAPTARAETLHHREPPAVVRPEASTQSGEATPESEVSDLEASTEPSGDTVRDAPSPSVPDEHAEPPRVREPLGAERLVADRSGAVPVEPRTLATGPRPTLLDLPSVVAPGDAWSFSLDAPAAVYVAIYALDGRLVAVLAQGRFEAGRHEFAFEPTAPGGFVVGARLGATTVRQRVHVVGVPTP